MHWIFGYLGNKLRFGRSEPVVRRYPGDFEPSLSTVLVNEKGEFYACSTEEMLNRELNRFKGWKCSAGSDSLHIGQKSEVLFAACKIMGEQGSALLGDFELPKEWPTCDRERCMCGGDLQLRKARSAEFVEPSKKPPLEKMVAVDSPVNFPVWSGPYHYPMEEDHFVTISWDMGKRCNYSCSYCPPEVSDRVAPLKTWEELKTVTDNIIKKYHRKQKFKWVVTGGEPTLIPDYIKWVRYVRKKGHIVHTTSNGSRGARYFEELIELSCVGISVHLEFLDLRRLQKTCQAIVDRKNQSKEAAKWWFGVRVMVPPGFLDEAEQVRNMIAGIDGFDEAGHFFVSPIHHYDYDEGQNILFGDLVDYSSEERSRLSQLNL